MVPSPKAPAGTVSNASRKGKLPPALPTRSGCALRASLNGRLSAMSPTATSRTVWMKPSFLTSTRARPAGTVASKLPSDRARTACPPTEIWALAMGAPVSSSITKPDTTPMRAAPPLNWRAAERFGGSPPQPPSTTSRTRSRLHLFPGADKASMIATQAS
jgi:hypothetical protein